MIFREFYSILPLYYNKILSLRTPLGPISRNKIRGPKTDPYTRGKIAGLYIAGISQRQIVDVIKRGHDSVQGAIALDILNTNSNSLPRPSRPRLYSDRDRRTILRNLRAFPKITFQQRREDTGLTMSNSYIKNIVYENSLKH